MKEDLRTPPAAEAGPERPQAQQEKFRPKTEPSKPKAETKSQAGPSASTAEPVRPKFSYASTGTGKKEDLGAPPAAKPATPKASAAPKPTPKTESASASASNNPPRPNTESSGPRPQPSTSEPRPKPRPDAQPAAAAGGVKPRPPEIANETDLYKVLGVEKRADENTIKKEFRKASLKYHPDKNDQNDKQWYGDQFAKLNQAYEILGDAEKRARYDAEERLKQLQAEMFGQQNQSGHAGSSSHPQPGSSSHPSASSSGHPFASSSSHPFASSSGHPYSGPYGHTSSGPHYNTTYHFPGQSSHQQYHSGHNPYGPRFRPQGPPPMAQPKFEVRKPEGWAEGFRNDGEKIYFRPGDVYQRAVRGWRDYGGRKYITDIGVSFVTGWDGAKMQDHFASQVLKLDRTVRTRPGENMTEAIAKLRDGTWVNAPWWKDYSPWYKAQGRGPTIIDYHGKPDRGEVTVAPGSVVLGTDGTQFIVTGGLPLRIDGKNFAVVQDGSRVFQQVFAHNPGGSFAHTACWVASGPFVREYLKAIGLGVSGMRYRYRNESHFAMDRLRFEPAPDPDSEGAIGVDNNGGFKTGIPASPEAKAKIIDRPDTRYSQEELRRFEAMEGPVPTRPTPSSGHHM